MNAEKKKSRNPKGSGCLYVRGNVYYAKWTYAKITHNVSTHVNVDAVDEKNRPCGRKLALAVLASLVEPYKHKDRNDVLALLARRLQEGKKTVQTNTDRHNDLLLKDLGKAFLRSTRRNDITKQHLDSYVAIAGEFAAWAGTDTAACDVSDRTASSWADAIWETNISPHTFNSKISVMRQIWTVLKPSIGFTENPWEGIKKKKNDASSRRVITDEELKKIYEAAGDRYGGDVRMLVVIGANTGMRISDCSMLQWDNIDFKNGFIRTKTKKTGAPVAIPLLSELRTALEAHKKRLDLEYEKADKTGWDEYWNARPAANRKEREANKVDAAYRGFVCPRLAARYLHERTLVVTLMTKTFKKAGLTTSENKGRGVRRRPTATFHSLRHTFVSKLKMSGVSERAAMELVGHRSEEISDAYTHIQEDFLKLEMKKMEQ